MFALRILLSGVLLIAAALCSTAAYYMLHRNEQKLFESQYNSISTSALDSVVKNFGRINLGLKEMASTYSAVFPEGSDWPNAAWPGFRSAAEKLQAVAALDNIAFSPIVQPGAQQTAYETYMKSYYLNDTTITISPLRPPWIDLGQLWKLETGYLPVRDLTGVTKYSNKTFLAPTAQYTYSEAIGPPYLSYNMHSFERFAPVFDAVVDCVAANNVTFAEDHCGSVSETVGVPFANFYYPNPTVTDVLAQLAHPIFPANDPGNLVGFVSGAASWRALLELAVPTFVDGLDCVITTGRDSYTYRITDGAPSLVGTGDLHDDDYSEYEQSARLQSPTLIGTGGVQYQVLFYPRDEFVQKYTSDVPIYAAVALVLVFVICTAIFVVYDVLMQRESGRRQAVLDTKRRFVRFISHEIRTPLNTVRLGMKLFESEMAAVVSTISKASPADLLGIVKQALASWKHLVDDVLSNSETAVEVLDDLLNYDKIEMGNLRLEYTLFNIFDLVKKTTSIMQMQAQQKNINLTLTTAPSRGAYPVSAAFLAGDSYRMGQVLRNLISNALKFTPYGGDVNIVAEAVEHGLPDAMPPSLDGTPTAAMLVRTTRAGSIRIAVKDSGAGLTPQQLEDICAEGVQFNANELQAGQGSGLGLFISKGIVDQHGGRLVVTSEGLGKGVTFTIELPVYREPERRASLRNSSPSSTVNQYNAQRASQTFSDVFSSSSSSKERDTERVAAGLSRRMLVVDDSPFNRKMLVRLLTSKGHNCEQAEDGADALKTYSDMVERHAPPDAILMDFEMPVMNGPTATAKLRELGCTCLIVGVTGNVLPDEQQYFRDCGADHVLPKPLVLEDFEKLLQSYVSCRHRLRSEEASTLHLMVKQDTSPKIPSANSSAKIHPMDEVV